MKTWFVAVLFLGLVIVDGVILPAVFGFREGFLSIAFLVFILLYIGDARGLVLSLIFSAFLEFYWSLSFGSLILPCLISFGLLIFLNNVFYTKNRILRVLLGVIIFVCFWGSSVLVNKIL